MNADEARRATLHAKATIAQLEVEQETARKQQAEHARKMHLANVVETVLPKIHEAITRATQHGLDLATYSFEPAEEHEVLEVLAQSLRLDGFETYCCESGTWLQVTW